MIQPADLFAGEALRPDDGGEFMPTPPWFSRPVLQETLSHYLLDGDEPLRVLDAGAGTGCLGIEAGRVCPAELMPLEITAVEQHAGRLSQCPTHWERVEADFFAWALQELGAGRRYDLVLTNPPFKKWWQWIEVCLGLVAPGGTLLAVAQLAWLGQKPAWWAERRPSTVWIAGRRPWPNAVQELGWVEWFQSQSPSRRGNDGEHTTLRWLELGR